MILPLRIFGAVLLFLGVAIFAFKTPIALGQDEGGVPVLDGLVFPPLSVGMGLFFVRFPAPDAARLGVGAGLLCASAFGVLLWMGRRRSR